MNKNNITSTTRQWLSIILLATLCVMGALLASMNQASAHASLVRVEPADGSVIATAPKSVALTFSEPTSPLVLKLVRPDGTSVALDHFVLRDATLAIEAPAGLGKGTHVLNWRIVSEDGHPVGGSAVFSIGAPSSGAAHVASEEVDWLLRVAIWAGKLTLYAGLFIGVGGACFANWIGGRSTLASPVALWTIRIALIATPLSVGLQGLDALGMPLSGLASSVVWNTGYSTSYGVTALVAAASLAAGLIALFTRGFVGKALSLLAVLCVGLALAASGHASAAHPQWLTRPAVFLHAVGIAFWAGSLIPLGAAFAARGPEAIAVLHRFSNVIPLSVLPLVAAGMVLAIIQLGSINALWSTAYGLVLVLKLILLATLFVLAAINRFWLTEPAEGGDPSAVARLRHSIRIEVALVLAIFAVAAMWRFTPPPRALAESDAASAAVHIHTDKAMADLTITPGHAGPISISIMIMTGDFGPLDAKEVILVLSNPAAGIEQIKRLATKPGDGTWHIEGLNLPLPGRWTVRIDVLISDFEMVKLEDMIEIRP